MGTKLKKECLKLGLVDYATGLVVNPSTGIDNCFIISLLFLVMCPME
jgi:hypothetical protein